MDTKKKNVTATRTFSIEGGPNKDRLCDAFKYAYSEADTIDIDFSVVIGYTMPPSDPGCAYVLMPISDVKITSLQHEDGSGESFNIGGYCKADLTHSGGRRAPTVCRFEAYYNAKTRKGKISFSE
ncbi:MAG: hypothetical protein ACOX0Z_03075 [Candidatus Nanosyncoccaceae bacterium]|jgi:hypothetical protein